MTQTQNNQTSQDHRIIAQSWQLEAAVKGDLQKIILPLTGGWVTGKMACEDLSVGFNVGDRIFLAEEWYPVEDRMTGLVKEYWTNSYFDGRSKAEFDQSLSRWVKPINGYSAETMPPEAAQHWFIIQNVQVIEARNLSPQDLIDCGLYPKDFHHLDCFETSEACEAASKRWNDAYYFWKSDALVVVLDIAFNQNLDELFQENGESRDPDDLENEDEYWDWGTDPDDFVEYL